jgi:hypothetical protein
MEFFVLFFLVSCEQRTACAIYISDGGIPSVCCSEVEESNRTQDLQHSCTLWQQYAVRFLVSVLPQVRDRHVRPCSSICVPQHTASPRLAFQRSWVRPVVPTEVLPAHLGASNCPRPLHSPSRHLISRVNCCCTCLYAAISTDPLTYTVVALVYFMYVLPEDGYRLGPKLLVSSAQ